MVPQMEAVFRLRARAGDALAALGGRGEGRMAALLPLGLVSELRKLFWGVAKPKPKEGY